MGKWDRDLSIPGIIQVQIGQGFEQPGLSGRCSSSCRKELGYFQRGTEIRPRKLVESQKYCYPLLPSQCLLQCWYKFGLSLDVPFLQISCTYKSLDTGNQVPVSLLSHFYPCYLLWLHSAVAAAGRETRQHGPLPANMVTEPQRGKTKQ